MKKIVADSPTSNYATPRPFRDSSATVGRSAVVLRLWEQSVFGEYTDNVDAEYRSNSEKCRYNRLQLV
jgi:hypothetical protein